MTFTDFGFGAKTVIEENRNRVLLDLPSRTATRKVTSRKGCETLGHNLASLVSDFQAVTDLRESLRATALAQDVAAFAQEWLLMRT
jgi:hypothetical protein